MAATFVSKMCRCILKLNKMINIKAILLLASRNSPVKQVTYICTYQHGLIVAYCSNMILKMAANVQIIT